MKTHLLFGDTRSKVGANLRKKTDCAARTKPVGRISENKAPKRIFEMGFINQLDLINLLQHVIKRIL